MFNSAEAFPGSKRAGTGPNDSRDHRRGFAKGVKSGRAVVCGQVWPDGYPFTGIKPGAPRGARDEVLGGHFVWPSVALFLVGGL
jgi:hypothetical protein